MSDLCTLTDLPTTQCGCAQHHHAETTVVSIGALEHLAGHPLPAYRAIIRPPWRVPTPEATVCEHQRDGLCKPCDELLDGLLADLPHLVEELGFAMRKDCRFAPHGFRRGDTQHPDESPLPWNPAAAGALGTLNRIVADRPQDRRELLRRLSTAAERAHAVIERPRDRQVSMCPVCRAEIVIDDRGKPVVCPVDGCAYSASWEHHQRDLLDANGDALLTMDDLLVVLSQGGESTNRNRINYLIRRHGLPRDEIQVPKWKDGVIVADTQWGYRLADVRDFQAKLENRRRSA